jgi:integrase
MSLEIKSKNPYKTVISSVLELAVDDGALQTNPALNIKLKQNEKRKVEYFTKDEVNRLLSVIPDGSLKVFLLIAFNTGMRSGEVLGLQLGDLGDGSISIKRTRTLGVVGYGKNQNATRIVPCPNYVIEEAKKLQKDNIFLFGDIDGSEKLHYFFKKYCKIAKVKNLRIYCTRHTFATLMLQDKIVSINELAGILGHSSVKTTLDKYASVISPDAVKISGDFSLYCDTTVTVEDNNIKKAL